MARLIKVSPYLRKDWRECLEDFLLVREANGLAKRTLADYRYHVKLFFTRYNASLNDYEALRRAVLQFFAESSQLAPDTFNMRRKFLKVFFAWAVQEGILPANPVDSIRAKKQRERVVEVDTEALQKLLEAPDLTTYVGLRDYALLCLTLDTGIRPSEALGLLPQDINLSSREVLVREEVAKTHCQDASHSAAYGRSHQAAAGRATARMGKRPCLLQLRGHKNERPRLAAAGEEIPPEAGPQYPALRSAPCLRHFVPAGGRAAGRPAADYGLDFAAYGAKVCQADQGRLEGAARPIFAAGGADAEEAEDEKDKARQIAGIMLIRNHLLPTVFYYSSTTTGYMTLQPRATPS